MYPFPYSLHGLCEDYLSCDIAFIVVMPLSRASTRGRYSRIEGVTDGMLMIRHVFLEINLFEVDGAVRSLETLAKLRHVKHVVHICKVGRKLKLIGEVACFANDL